MAALGEMEFYCEDASNETIRKEALNLLYQSFPGYWVIFFVGVVGLFNNVILLIVAYRLGWFHEPQYALIIGQTCHDAILALMIIIQSVFQITYYFSNAPELFRQLWFLILCIPVEIFQDLDQITSMMIALDRVFSALAPNQWASLGYTYRLIMLALAWTWAILEDLPWFFFVKDVCVKVCSLSSYPDSWYSEVKLSLDTVVSFVIVGSYLILPTLSKGYIRRLTCSYLVIAIDDMERRQQVIIERVRMLSLRDVFCMVQPIRFFTGRVKFLIPLFMAIIVDT